MNFKQFSLSVLFLFICISWAQGQHDDDIKHERYPNNVEYKEEVFFDKVKRFRSDIRDRHEYLSSRVRIGFSTYLVNDDEWELPPSLEYLERDYYRSINLNWDIIRNRGVIINNFLHIDYGLTWSIMNYGLDESTRLVPDTNPTSFVSDDIEYDKNILKTSYFQIPLMFTLGPNNGNRESFSISAGGYAGILAHSKQKLKSDQFGKEKIKDDFNLNRFRYGLEATVRLGHFEIYGQYALSELFEDGKGPQLTPINIGVTLFSF